MAKFLLVSDFQLGRQFSGLGRSGDLVRKALKRALENSVTLALESSVDFLAISGNLFANNLVSRNLIDFFFKHTERLGRIPCVVVPGELDCLDANSIYRHMPIDNRPENLYVMGANRDRTVNLADSEITIYAIPDFGKEAPQHGWQVPARANFEGRHVLIAANREAVELGEPHSLSPIMQQVILRNNYDFIAVGGNPHYRQWAPDVCSVGSPESLSFEPGDSGLALMVEFDKQSVHAEPNPIGELNWKHLVIDSSKFLYNIEIERELQKLAGANTLLKLEIVGSGHGDGFLDLTALERSQGPQFCHLQIEDHRTFTPENTRVASENGGSLIGEYTMLLNEGIEKAPGDLKAKYFEAMSTGRALLLGKDVI